MILLNDTLAQLETLIHDVFVRTDVAVTWTYQRRYLWACAVSNNYFHEEQLLTRLSENRYLETNC